MWSLYIQSSLASERISHQIKLNWRKILQYTGTFLSSIYIGMVNTKIGLFIFIVMLI